MLSVRAAEYILEELRSKHPGWNAPADKIQCDRMVKVLVLRSIKRAEQCEAHLRNGLRMARKAQAETEAKAAASAKAEEGGKRT